MKTIKLGKRIEDDGGRRCMLDRWSGKASVRRWRVSRGLSKIKEAHTESRQGEQQMEGRELKFFPVLNSH